MKKLIIDGSLVGKLKDLQGRLPDIIDTMTKWETSYAKQFSDVMEYQPEVIKTYPSCGLKGCKVVVMLIAEKSRFEETSALICAALGTVGAMSETPDTYVAKWQGMEVNFLRVDADQPLLEPQEGWPLCHQASATGSVAT